MSQNDVQKYIRLCVLIIYFQGDLRRMWSEPFISQQPSTHMDV